MTKKLVILLFCLLFFGCSLSTSSENKTTTRINQKELDPLVKLNNNLFAGKSRNSSSLPLTPTGKDIMNGIDNRISEIDNLLASGTNVVDKFQLAFEKKLLENNKLAMSAGSIIWNKQIDRKFSVPVYFNNNKYETVDYGIGYGESEGNIPTYNLYFEGTKPNIDDWMPNIDFQPISYNFITGKMYANTGLVAYYLAAKKHLLNSITLNKSVNPKIIIYLSGHSQGGALIPFFHNYFKEISGKGNNPIIELNTVGFGAPGQLWNLPGKDQPGLKKFMQNTADILQFNYGYDLVPYFYSENSPPVGRYFTIGPYNKVLRVPVSDWRESSSTIIRKRRTWVGGLENTAKSNWEYKLSDLSYLQGRSNLLECTDMNDFSMAAFIVESMTGGYSGNMPTFDFDKFDHLGYYRVFGPEPLSKINDDSLYHIKKHRQHYITQHGLVNYRNEWDTSTGGGNGILNIENIGSLKFDSSKHYNWRLIGKVTFNNNVEIPPYTNLDFHINNPIINYVENSVEDFLSYYTNKNNWDLKIVGEGSLIINKPVVIKSPTYIDNSFGIKIVNGGKLYINSTIRRGTELGYNSSYGINKYVSYTPAYSQSSEYPKEWIKSGVKTLIPYKDGVIAWFGGSKVFYSPDGKNINGGGNTIKVYNGVQSILAIIPLKNGVLTAFSRGGIYYSPDGKNIGGGGGTTLIYNDGQTVRAMVPYKNGMIIAFSGKGIYKSTDGRNIGKLIYNGSQYVMAMSPHKGGVIFAFSRGGIYKSEDGNNIGRLIYGGRQTVRLIKPYKNGLITAFSRRGIYYSPDGNYPGGGSRTQQVYSGGQYITNLHIYKNNVVSEFEKGGIYLSKDGKNVGGGGNTIEVYSR